MEEDLEMRNTCLYTNRPKTFRRSSTSLFEWGGNLQNIEKSVREIYHPDGFSEDIKGKCKYWLQTGDTSVFTEEELLKLNVFAQTDQSGAEDLVVSYDSNAGNSRACYINRIKKHSFVAMHLFPDVWQKKMKEEGGLIEDLDVHYLCSLSIPDLAKSAQWPELGKLIKKSDDWSLTERYYYFAKQTVHSANYEIRENTFVLNVLDKSGGKIVIPTHEGKRFLEVYRALFPEIPERNRRVEQQVREHRMIFNLHGHPYIITNYNITDSNLKEYYAWGPQSTVGEITRICATNFQNYVEEHNKPWDFMADTHDSILTQGPLFDVKERIQKQQEFMNQKLISPIDGVEFSMKSETNIGFNWSSYKKDTNELGLQELTW